MEQTDMTHRERALELAVRTHGATALQGGQGDVDRPDADDIIGAARTFLSYLSEQPDAEVLPEFSIEDHLTGLLREAHSLLRRVGLLEDLPFAESDPGQLSRDARAWAANVAPEIAF